MLRESTLLFVSQTLLNSKTTYFRIVLSDEAINQMITISSLMTEVKESIHEKIKEINNHEDTLLEVMIYKTSVVTARDV